MTEKRDQKITYSDIESQIIRVLDEEGGLERLGIASDTRIVILGITMINIQEDLVGLKIGDSKTIPTVILANPVSGQIYHVALKVLLPDLDI